jgi:hypothetical protein
VSAAIPRARAVGRMRVERQTVHRDFGLAELLARDQFLDKGNSGLICLGLKLLRLSLRKQAFLDHSSTQTRKLTLCRGSNHFGLVPQSR